MNKVFALGAARWNQAQISLYRDLVSCLKNRGYEVIVDTSILYGDFERVIPSVLFGQESIVINTKFGDFSADKIDDKVIYAQLKQSKKSIEPKSAHIFYEFN